MANTENGFIAVNKWPDPELLGLREQLLLLSTAVLIGITMPFGYLGELIARPLSEEEWRDPLYIRLLPWTIGNIPQITAWSVVVVQFYIGFDTSLIPSFVFVILWVELTLFFSFGFVALAQLTLPPKHFWRGELAFQVLSLVSKGLLGILLISNVLVLSSFDDLLIS